MKKKDLQQTFGVSLLVAAFDTTPRLYSVEPSGSFLSNKGKTIGSAPELLDCTLEEDYDMSMSQQNGIQWMLFLLNNVIKDKMTEKNVQASVVDKSGVKMLTPSKYLVFINKFQI